MILIKEVKTKKEQKEFLNFPLNLYKGNDCFVPPLYGDEKKIFSKNYMYNDTCEAVYYNAYMDGKIVGRISGIIQRASNKKTNENRARFTRFDSIDNQEVANALFGEVEKWAKSKGMDIICGPLGFSDLEREGLLIEGFNELATFEEQYNYDYYQKLIENLGYVKEVDWLERKIYPPKEISERAKKLSGLMMDKYNLHFGTARNINDFLRKYSEGIFHLIDTTYDKLYGTVPFTEAMKKNLIANFKLIISLKYTAVICDEKENVVCFALCFPSLARAVQKSNGRLTPAGLIRILKAVKNPKIIDLALIGVIPEYLNRGISTALMVKLLEILLEQKIEYAETNLNLEDNLAIQNQWKNFENVLHKRRRAFIKKI